MKRSLDKTMNSLMLDNGVEFALHETISDSMDADVFFCEQYNLYQKGAIENANKLIINQLPKRAEIDEYSQVDIDSIIDNFNSRPMKCLEYHTPKEVFSHAFNLQLI